MQFDGNNNKVWKKAKQSPLLGSAVAFMAVVVVMSVASDTFLTAGNLTNLIRQGAVLSIAAIGQTFVIITGGIDLSVMMTNV